jgi:predicted enzyme related to lactoylglutathione lyase
MSDHSIVHIEIPASDPTATGKFYAEAFGWQTDADQMYNYTQFRAQSGPGGGFPKVTDGTAAETMQYKPGEVLIYIGTEDIDGTLARIEALGGKTVLPRTEIPHVGWYAVFTDPTGNRVALYTAQSQGQPS